MGFNCRSVVIILVTNCIKPCNGYYQAGRLQQRSSLKPNMAINNEKCLNDGIASCNTESSKGLYKNERRTFLVNSASLLLGATAIAPKSNAEGILEGRWMDNNNEYKKNNDMLDNPMDIPLSFVTYASRIIIHYDNDTLLLDHKINEELFGNFAMSVQMGIQKYMSNEISKSNYETLAAIFLDKYSKYEGAVRHIGILFSLLPKNNQPIEFLQKLKKTKQTKPPVDNRIRNEDINAFLNDPRMLLPSYYTFTYNKSSSSFIVNPPIEDILNRGNAISSENQNESIVSTTTPFGPRSTLPLKRDLPNYNPYIYSLLALSGGISCAITHTVVIPLDVVKTRMQTEDLTKLQYKENAENTDMISYAKYIIQTEGIDALLLGTSATIAGFLWYGISVYPSYLFFKRFLSNIIAISLSSDLLANMDTVNTIISLLSGALASVIASIGLTPMEACRIRTVAQPEVYKPLGLSGTIAALANEDKTLGYQLLYAGFPSLVTRQVIFGSIKFLTFERTCAYLTSILLSSSYGMEIYNEYTFTPFIISLLSGAVAGSLSSIISQPADSVLTYVSKQKNDGGSIGVIEGAKIMIENEGFSSLFRGSGSRCLWAGCIIAGQFCLYDVFRSLFGVSGDNLSQVLEVVIGP